MSALQTLEMLNREGMEACNQGRYEDALFKLNQALDIAEKTERHIQHVIIKNNMGLVYQIMGKTGQAEVCFKLALHEAETHMPPESLPLKKVRRNLETLLDKTTSKAA